MKKNIGKVLLWLMLLSVPAYAINNDLPAGSKVGGQIIASLANKLSDFASTTSAQLRSVISDTTGTGSLVFNASPTITGTITGSISGNAGTATALQTGRAINGVTFDGTAPITVPAAAGTLTGATLASGVTASSLTSLGVAPALGTPSSVVLTNATGLPLAGMLTNTANTLLGYNNSGAAADVTIGSGVALSGGVLSATGSGGTVTTASVVSANGLAGTVATATSTPAITLSTTVTGIVKGNGTALSAASAGTDYVVPGGALGTPSSGVATNLTGTAASLTAGTATNAVNTGITDDTTTNATMYPTWVTANTGNLPQKTTSTKLSFNPSTGALSSTSFTGAGTGLTGTAASLTAGNVTTNANLTGPITSVGNAVASLSAHAALIGNGTSAIATVAPSTSGNVLTSNGTDWVSQAPAGGSAFSAITSATNTTAAMVVGTGATLGTSGSGTITATAMPASGLTGTTLASSVTASSLTSFGSSIALGTPASGVATNLTGTAAALNIGGNAATATTAGTLTTALSANQLLGSLTAVAPTGQTVPSCSTSASALLWTSGTGFSCNTALAAPASAITGATLASGVTASSLTSFGASIALGTPASGVMTNVTGTAAGLTAGTVTTNANMTGDITGTGNVLSNTGTKNFYVTNPTYGALCNGQYRADGTTTGSSATISATGYSFTSADVGKYISVWAGTAITPSSGTVTIASNQVTVGSTTGLKPGMMVYNANFNVGTYVTGVVNSTIFTTSQAAVTGGTSQSFSIYPVINTTISSVSGGNAVLATTMTSSLSGNAYIAFGTNDATALQAADTAAKNAGGGTIVLPAGMCVTASTIVIDNKVSVIGQGEGVSIIKYLATTDQQNPVLEGINQSNNATCSPTVALLQSNNSFSYFQIDGLSAIAGTSYVQAKGIGLPCSFNSIIDHVYVHDTPATCVATDEGMPTQVSNNLLVNCGRLRGVNSGANGVGEGSLGIQGESYTITGNVVINPDHFGIFVESETAATTLLASTAITGNVVIEGGNSQQATQGGAVATAGIGNSGVIGVAITGNYVYGIGLTTNAPNWAGITTDGGTFATASGVQSVISGNYVSGTNGCILVNYFVVAPSSNANTIISGNNCVGSTGLGIELITTAASTFMQNVQITGNQVSGAGSACYGVLGTGVAKNLTFTDNVGVDCGSLSGTTDYRKAGIAFASNITNLTMHGNNFYDDGANTQKYGMSVNTSVAITGADISANNFSNNHTQPLDMLGTITGVINSNVGMPAPTISGCTATSPTGNGDIGTYTSGTTGSCAVTITPYGTSNIIANHGYQCTGFDSTTTADVQTQTAYTTTSATISGTTVSADIIPFNCRMW